MSSVTTTYKVSGMSCGHCETAVSGEISEIDGVTAVKAVASSGEVTVTSGVRPRRRGRTGRRRRSGLRADGPRVTAPPAGSRTMTSTAARETPTPSAPGTVPVPQGPTARDEDRRRVELSIGGMTCASCAARIEKKLNRMDGVSAGVNYATHKANVSYADDVSVADLIATVERTGYTAEQLPPPRSAPDPADPPAVAEHKAAGAVPRRQRTDRAVAAVPRHARTVRAGGVAGDGAVAPVRELAMALAHAGLARGRLGRSALPPRHLDEPAARRRHHGHPDHGRHARGLRLVAVGALLRRCRHARHAARLRLHPRHERGAASGSSALYLEVAAGVTTFLLLGRYLEARAKRKAGHRDARA